MCWGCYLKNCIPEEAVLYKRSERFVVGVGMKTDWNPLKRDAAPYGTCLDPAENVWYDPCFVTGGAPQVRYERQFWSPAPSSFDKLIEEEGYQIIRANFKCIEVGMGTKED